jgi:hypothetical protein
MNASHHLESSKWQNGTVVAGCVLQPRVNKQGYAGALIPVNSRYEDRFAFSCIRGCN